MNLKIKLGLLFGSLTLLLIISASLSYLFVKRIDTDVQKLGQVVEPLIVAALSSELKSFIQYSLDQDEEQLRGIIEAKIEFASALGEFVQLAETDQERQAILKIGQIYFGLRDVGLDIIQVDNDIQASSARISQDVGSVAEILKELREVRIDRNAPDGPLKLEAVLDMITELDEAFLAIKTYIDNPDPQFRQAMREEAAEFEDFAGVLRSSQLSLDEADLLAEIDEVFPNVITLGERVMDQAEARSELLVKVVTDLEEIDRIVVEDVQPLILAETINRLNDAEASVGLARLSVFILVALGAVVSVGAMVIVARQIVDPIVRLKNAAIELGMGNLAVRAKSETRDEIGSLADSFNQMAEARQVIEEESLALITQLAERNEVLAQLDEFKDDFMASVSHELRTPLTAIKGSAEILLDDADVTEFQQRFLVIINSESDRLTRLINNILDLTRYEAGQQQWNDKMNSIGGIVSSAVSGIQSLEIQKNLEMNVNMAPDLPDVWCDHDKINQVLTNLLSNAIKFTPESGEIGVSVKQEPAPGGTEHGGVIEVRVSDSGIGIAPEDLDEIFKRFKQVGNNLTTLYKGTGLGLPICREIVDHYGGRIWAESEPGNGSVFIFTLPVNQGGAAADSPQAGAAVEPSRTGDSGPHPAPSD